jgi:hypothetical protein
MLLDTNNNIRARTPFLVSKRHRKQFRVETAKGLSGQIEMSHHPHSRRGRSHQPSSGGFGEPLPLGLRKTRRSLIDDQYQPADIQR